MDVACSWIYLDLEIAPRAMPSAGPAERVIRNSGMERARDVVPRLLPIRHHRGNMQQFRFVIAPRQNRSSPRSRRRLQEVEPRPGDITSHQVT